MRRVRCDHCDELTERDELVETVDGKVCPHCAEEYFTRCEECGDYVYNADSTRFEDGEIVLCHNCEETLTTICGCCEHRRMKDNMCDTAHGSVCQTCLDEEYFLCEICEERHHVDDANSINDDAICDGCVSDYYVVCEDCGEYVHVDDALYDHNDNHYCDNCWQNRDEDYCGMDNQAFSEDSYTPDPALPKQKVIQTSPGCTGWVEVFYEDWEEPDLQVHEIEPINIKGSVSIAACVGGPSYNLIERLHSNDWIAKGPGSFKDGTVEVDGQVVKVSKRLRKNVLKLWKRYKDGFPHGDIPCSVCDTLHAVTDIKNVDGEIVRDLSETLLNEFCKSAAKTESKFTYEISNDQDFKMESMGRNGYFNSCQVPGNAAEYARGAYDLIGNGGNSIVLIKDEKGKIQGRILLRYFLNRDGKKFLSVERLYAEGVLSGAKKEFLTQFLPQLKKKSGVEIIVTNRSSHTATLYDILAGSLKLTKYTERLRQPTRSYNHDTKRFPGYYRECGSKDYMLDDGSIYSYLGENIEKYTVD